MVTASEVNYTIAARLPGSVACQAGVEEQVNDPLAFCPYHRYRFRYHKLTEPIGTAVLHFRCCLVTFSISVNCPGYLPQVPFFLQRLSCCTCIGLDAIVILPCFELYYDTENSLLPIKSIIPTSRGFIYHIICNSI